MAAEVAYDFFRTRVDASLTTEYPQPIDIRQDIDKPGKIDNWVRQVNAALNTRNVLRSLRERPATLEEIRLNSPGADDASVMATFQAYTINRQSHYKAAAAKLPTLIKGLTQVEQREFDALQLEDNGPAIYEKIMNLLDLSSGVAQDLVRQKFNSIGVQPTDTMNKVITAVDHVRRHSFHPPLLVEPRRPLRSRSPR